VASHGLVTITRAIRGTCQRDRDPRASARRAPDRGNASRRWL